MSSPSPYSSLTDLCGITPSDHQGKKDVNIDQFVTTSVEVKNITQQNTKIEEIENLDILPMRRIKSDMFPV